MPHLTYRACKARTRMCMKCNRSSPIVAIYLLALIQAIRVHVCFARRRRLSCYPAHLRANEMKYVVRIRLVALDSSRPVIVTLVKFVASLLPAIWQSGNLGDWPPAKTDVFLFTSLIVRRFGTFFLNICICLRRRHDPNFSKVQFIYMIVRYYKDYRLQEISDV